jgi:hypothetical protein
VKVRNISGHVVDLDSGRVLAPGERAEIEDSDRTQLLLDSELLTEDKDAEVSSTEPVTVAPPVTPVPTTTVAPDTTVQGPTPAATEASAEAPTDEKGK